MLAMISTTTVTPSTPTIQPSTNIALFARARCENSIRITATMGIGQIATPSASRKQIADRLTEHEVPLSSSNLRQQTGYTPTC